MSVPRRSRTQGHVTDVMETTIWLRTAGLPKKSVIMAEKWNIKVLARGTWPGSAQKSDVPALQ